jgi:hypothetical protein
MSASHDLSPLRVSGVPGQRRQLIRYAATGTAAATALLYVLSGTAGPIKLGFSLAMGVVFTAVAIVLFQFGQGLVWELVALLDLGAIIGYFIVAPSRDPHFELWGVAIKVVQAILLAALGYVVVKGRRSASHG